MAILKEIPITEPEQLTFKAFELSSLTVELLEVEYRKKESNDEFNTQIKALKKNIAKLAYEIKNERK